MKIAIFCQKADFNEEQQDKLRSWEKLFMRIGAGSNRLRTG